MENEVIGKMFYQVIGSLLKVIYVSGYLCQGDEYLGDCYEGKSTLIIGAGKAITLDWDCDKEEFQKGLNSGVIKQIM